MRTQDIEPRFETILGRLVARNEQLDRQLEAALRRVGLTKKALAQFGELARRIAPERLARAEREIRAETDRSAVREPWEVLTRPSVEELSHRFGRRLLRV
jgi:DNA-binding transcriptional regulator YdaS (Cro superfamily)